MLRPRCTMSPCGIFLLCVCNAIAAQSFLWNGRVTSGVINKVSHPPSKTKILQAMRTPSTADTTESLSFLHETMVFVEMTDMYGIVYHPNYVTYMLRAMQHKFGVPPQLHCLKNVKFRQAATLGVMVRVSGKAVACDKDSGRSVWQVELMDASDASSRVLLTAEATVSWPAMGALPPGCEAPEAEVSREIPTGLLEPLPEEFFAPSTELDATVWQDELTDGKLSYRAILTYFERVRTMSLGVSEDGELALESLQKEGFAVVLSGIQDFRFDPEGVALGDKLKIMVGVRITKGGRVLNMYHSLWRQDGGLVAHASIALFCMDTKTLKFRTVPQWIQDRVNSGSSS